MRVFIIRHTAVDVPHLICYGQTDVPLRASFPEEASRVRERLQGLTFDAVFTSPLSRCTRLADFCGFPDAVRDERLLELNFGDWEWKFIYSMRNEPEVDYWFEHQLTQPAPNGESFLDLKARFLEFIRERRASGLGQIGVFSHGGILLSAMIHQGVELSGDIFLHLPDYGAVIPFDF